MRIGRIQILKNCKDLDIIHYTKIEKILLFCDIMLDYYYNHDIDLLEIMLYYEKKSTYLEYLRFKTTSKLVKKNSNVSQKKMLKGLHVNVPKKNFLYYLKKEKYTGINILYENKYSRNFFIPFSSKDKWNNISQKDNFNGFFTNNIYQTVFLIYNTFICAELTLDTLFIIIETVAADICKIFCRHMILGSIFIPYSDDSSFFELYLNGRKKIENNRNPRENIFFEIYMFFSYLSFYFNFMCEFEFESEYDANIKIEKFAGYAKGKTLPTSIYQDNLSDFKNETLNWFLINHNSEQVNGINITKRVNEKSVTDTKTKSCELDIPCYTNICLNYNDKTINNEKALIEKKFIEKQRLVNPHPEFDIYENNGCMKNKYLKLQVLYGKVLKRINNYLVHRKKFKKTTNNMQNFYADLMNLVTVINVVYKMDDLNKVDGDKTRFTRQQLKQVNDRLNYVFSRDFYTLFNDLSNLETQQCNKFIHVMNKTKKKINEIYICEF